MLCLWGQHENSAQNVPTFRCKCGRIADLIEKRESASLPRSTSHSHCAVRRASRAAPDGYTLSIGNVATHVLNGAAYSLSYDLLNDFEAISLLTGAPAFIDAKKR